MRFNNSAALSKHDTLACLEQLIHKIQEMPDDTKFLSVSTDIPPTNGSENGIAMKVHMGARVLGESGTPNAFAMIDAIDAVDTAAAKDGMIMIRHAKVHDDILFICYEIMTES